VARSGARRKADAGVVAGSAAAYPLARMLSFSKILLVGVILVAVIFGTRLLRSLTGGGGGPVDAGTAKGGAPGAVDLVACASCGNYVDPDAGGCERADCPYS